jgi:hypothetical protein
MQKMTLRLDDSLHQRLKDSAERDGRSLQGQIAWMLKDHLENPPGQPILTAHVHGFAGTGEVEDLVRQLNAAGIPVVPPGQIEAEVAEDIRHLTGSVQ